MKTSKILAASLAAAALVSSINAQGFVDLQAVSVKSSHSQWNPLQRVTISATIKNASQRSVGGVACAIFLSRDTKISSDDLLLTSFSMMRLKIGGIGTQALTVDTPLGIRGGRYHVILSLDHNKKLREIKENNNIATQAVTGSPQADVRISSLRILTPGPTAGKTITVDYTAKNHGGTTATVETGLYLSTNGSISQSDYFVGADTIGFLAAGASIRRFVTIKIPSHLQGDFYLAAWGDHANKIKESLENNNIRGIKTRINKADATVQRLEFQPVRVTSAHYSNQMTVLAKDGGNAMLALTAPKMAGKPYLMALSRKQQFEVDDLTMLGITYVNSPFFAAWLGTMDSNGYAFSQMRIPPGVAKTSGYIHAFFNGSLAQPIEKPVKVTVR